MEKVLFGDGSAYNTSSYKNFDLSSKEEFIKSLKHKVTHVGWFDTVLFIKWVCYNDSLKFQVKDQGQWVAARGVISVADDQLSVRSGGGSVVVIVALVVVVVGSSGQ